jgi:hypothetical protein
VTFSARLRNRSGQGIDDLTVSVRFLDGNGARVDELRAHRQPLSWQRLAPGERRTWDLVARLDPARPAIDLARVQLTPRTAAFCDGATWQADGPSVPSNPMWTACPTEVDLGAAPPLEVRDGRVHGRGYSFAVPDGYEVDPGWGGRSLRRQASDASIGILPAMSGWLDLDPVTFDLVQCRNLLAYNMYVGNLRFEVQRVSPEVTTCARYIESTSQEIIQEIIVATRGEDFRIGCPYPETMQGCLDVARSVQHSAP